MAIVLDDEGTGGEIESLCAAGLSSPPNYLPAQALSAFDGMQAAGDWTISVSDHFALDPGTLVGWSLHVELEDVCGPGGVCVPDCAGQQCGDDGCGGSCGLCGPGDSCNVSGQCEAACVPGPDADVVAAVREAIPNGGGEANPLTHTIQVAESVTIDDLDIGLELTHTWVGDLVVTVEHLGIEVTLIDRMGIPASTFGCARDDLSILLDDEGTGGAIETRCANSLTSPPGYTPNEALSAFDGMDAAGDWVIRISDHFAQDAGALVEWSVHVDGAEICP